MLKHVRSETIYDIGQTTEAILSYSTGYYCFCKLPAVFLLKPGRELVVSKWEKWMHEETSDVAVLLTLFGSNAEVVRLQSVNAALTRFKSVTGSSDFVLSYFICA